MTPASPASRVAFDTALAEERESSPDLTYSLPTLPHAGSGGTPYPAPVAEIGGVPPPLRVRSTLPGEGRRGPGCGSKTPLGWLAADGCLPLTIHECSRRECPRCAAPHTADECDLGVPHGGGDWAHTEALVVASKLQGYAVTQGIDRLRQVVVSPPLARFDEAGDHRRVIGRVRHAAAKALRELGWGGRYWASLVVHLYRGCVEAGGYHEWGPHAHAVGPGIDARRTEDYWFRTGGSYWMNPHAPEEPALDAEGRPLIRSQGVVVKQPNGKDGGFASYWGRRLVRHLVYELGHSAIVPNGHAVSYVGKGLIGFAPPPPEPPESEEESAAPACPHRHEFRRLGDGSRPKYDADTREWTFRGSSPGSFYRFLDRAPAQGGPLLERVGESGRPVPVAISPYLDLLGLDPPRPVRRPARRQWGPP